MLNVFLYKNIDTTGDTGKIKTVDVLILRSHYVVSNNQNGGGSGLTTRAFCYSTIELNSLTVIGLL